MNNYTEKYPDVVNSTSVDLFTTVDTDGTNSTTVDFRTAVYLSPEVRAVTIIYKVCTPCILLLGGFGNVATIFVLHRIKDPNSSQHVFLIALAVADLSCLYSNTLFRCIYHYSNFRVWTLHSVTCKLYLWLQRVFFRLSAWLVTAVTVQRTLAIKWPHKIRMVCTVRRTWIVLAALIFVSCAVNSHFLVMWRVQNDLCSYYKSISYVFFLRKILTWLSLSIGSLLPFACLLVCDVILSMSLFQATSTTSVANQAISNATSAQNDDSRRETARRTTIMILALSITFFILTLPLQMVIMWYNFDIVRINRNPRLYALNYLMNRIGWLLVSTNSAINFFLYCFTGTRFRKEFLSWICCSVANPSSGFVGKTAFGSSKGERTQERESTQESRLTRS